MFEHAFEDAYTKTRGDKGRLTNWFGAPFNVVIEEASQIRNGDVRQRLPQPVVLLNTFDAKSGHHAVVSNATFAEDRNQPEKNLSGPVNILDYLAGETCETPSTVSLRSEEHRYPYPDPSAFARNEFPHGVEPLPAGAQEPFPTLHAVHRY